MMKTLFISLILTALMGTSHSAFGKDTEADDAVKAAEALTTPASEKNTLIAPEASIKTTPETQIPVNLDAAKKSGAGENPLYKVLAAIGILGMMACGAYFFIRKYKHTAGKQSQATQIKILTQHYLGPKKSLAIIRVAEESILVGITDQNINLIKSLSLLDEEIPEETPKSFGKVFSKTQNLTAAAEAQEASEDDFAISGIKDFVSSKLKNMRSLE
jgi:flagellar protein FliO/FliZ